MSIDFKLIAMFCGLDSLLFQTSAKLDNSDVNNIDFITVHKFIPKNCTLVVANCSQMHDHSSILQSLVAPDYAWPIMSWTGFEPELESSLPSFATTGIRINSGRLETCNWIYIYLGLAQ